MCDNVCKWKYSTKRLFSIILKWCIKISTLDHPFKSYNIFYRQNYFHCRTVSLILWLIIHISLRWSNLFTINQPNLLNLCELWQCKPPCRKRHLPNALPTPWFYSRRFLTSFFLLFEANVSIRLRADDISTQTSNLSPKTHREDDICKSVDRLVKSVSDSILSEWIVTGRIMIKVLSSGITIFVHEKEFSD